MVRWHDFFGSIIHFGYWQNMKRIWQKISGLDLKKSNEQTCLVDGNRAYAVFCSYKCTICECVYVCPRAQSVLTHSLSVHNRNHLSFGPAFCWFSFIWKPWKLFSRMELKLKLRNGNMALWIQPTQVICNFLPLTLDFN